MTSGTMEMPDMSKDHDIACNPLDGSMTHMLCSCEWSYECAAGFEDAVKNRHYGKFGLVKLT